MSRDVPLARPSVPRPATWTRLVLGLLPACTPGGGPLDAVVARYDDARDRYEPGVEEIRTLSDPGRLEGSAATVRARGNLDLSLPPTLSREGLSETLRAEFLADPGDPVRPDLLWSGDVVVGRDYESFALLSLYHHVEAAQAFLVSCGADPAEVEALDVLYLPFAHFGTNGETREVTDNFFYLYGTRVLAALRLERLREVPVAQNEGVVTHEVAHALWDARVLDVEATFRRLVADTDPRAVNLLDAMSEGTADFLGALQTGDPDFLRHSVPPELVGDCPECLLRYPRDLSGPAPLDADWITNANLPPSVYLQTAYRVGTSFASALWRASEDREATARALVAALTDLGQRLRDEPPWEDAPGSFGPAWLLDPILGGLDPAAASALCDLVETDLAPIARFVTGCES